MSLSPPDRPTARPPDHPTSHSPDRPIAHTPLGTGGEFDRIRAVWRRLGARMAPAGDDCALVELDGVALALSTDLAIEGTHFRLGWLEPREVGWRATAAALSDLAAVAAEPAGVLVSLGIPTSWPEASVTDLMEGVGDAAEAVGATLWGGDLVASERVVLDLAVVGRVADPVRRRGARPGDVLWVTGRLGGPAAALAAWNAGEEPDRTARERFAAPRARVREAQWLQQRGARAMIDISDGLVADAGQLAAASSVAWVIEVDRVPVHPAAAPATALVSGEEYELLVALPSAAPADIGRAFQEAFGVPLTRIGAAHAGSGVRLVRDGAPVDVPAGFVHF